MNRDKIPIYGYMCGVDFQHELGEASDGNIIYPSVNNLKQNKPCWKECGIVKVKITLEEWIEEQDF
jgi:hypothetical protein